MNWWQALLLGIIQGIAEFLPISSSGHIELGKVILQLEPAVVNNQLFTLVVHLATSLSTIVVYRKDILDLIAGLLKFEANQAWDYVSKIAIATIPIALIGIPFKDRIDALFDGNVILVGWMLLFTAALLAICHYSPKGDKPVSRLSALWIGIAQTIAILPGLSRSGSTISTALVLKIDRAEAARFSFLIVLVPILGASLLKGIDLVRSPEPSPIGLVPLLIGFVTSFVIGLIACRGMISVVKRSGLLPFAIYCTIVGTITLLIGWGYLFSS